MFHRVLAVWDLPRVSPHCLSQPSAGKGWADVLPSRRVGVSLQPCCRTGNFAQQLQQQICKETISAERRAQAKRFGRGVLEAKQLG